MVLIVDLSTAAAVEYLRKLEIDADVLVSPESEFYVYPEFDRFSRVSGPVMRREQGFRT